MTVLIAQALTIGALAATSHPPGQTFDCARDDCGKTPHLVINRHRRHMRRVVAPYREFFDRVAACESGGRWHLSTGNGFYGGLQFTLQSWRGVGGTGYPQLATRLEQRYRAVRLLHLQGPGAWPVCGR